MQAAARRGGEQQKRAICLLPRDWDGASIHKPAPAKGSGKGKQVRHQMPGSKSLCSPGVWESGVCSIMGRH